MMSTTPLKRTVVSVAAIAAVTTLLFTGCTSKASDDTADTTLTVLSQATSLDFNPATSVTLPTTWLGLIGRRLTTWKVGADGTPSVVPDLATDTGTPSEDGTVWTYTLKDDILFQDGTPITSGDIKYGIERTFAPELAGGLTYHQALLVGGSDYTGPYDGGELDSIETPDDKTLVFHLNSADGDWPWIASTNAFIPVPKAADTDPTTYGKAPIASGPYQIESNDDGVETVLVRNPNWSAATDDVRTADPDEIVFKQSQNADTLTQSLISDSGDAKNSINADPLTAAQLNLVSNDPSASERLVTSKGGLLNYIAINTDRVPDVRVRQALEYAIDRTSVVIAQGGNEAAGAATTLIGSGIPGHEDYDLYPTDVAKAKSLLADAGESDLELTLWASNDDGSQAQAQAVQQSLAAAGVTVTIQPMDFETLYGDAMGGNPDYDLFMSYWVPDYPSASASLSLLFDSSYIDGGYNLARYNNPEVDELMATATAETDQDAANAQWTAIDKKIMEDAAMIPLTESRNSYLAGSNVTTVEVPEYPAFQNYLTLALGE
jgi:peptide/nickel transport system substrate-binding protein